ncbi:hypothetical protein C0993_008170, partial [Termitomyces sp. T159_Od127]
HERSNMDNITAWATLQEVEESDSDAEIDELLKEQPSYVQKQFSNSDIFKAICDQTPDEATSSTSDSSSFRNGGSNSSSTAAKSSGSHPTIVIEHRNDYKTSSRPVPMVSQDNTNSNPSALVKTPIQSCASMFEPGFEQNVTPQVKRIDSTPQESISSPQTHRVPVFEYADRSRNASETATSIQANSSTRLRGQQMKQRRKLHEYKLAGANVSSILFSKRSSIGSNIMRLNLRHLFKANKEGAHANVLGTHKMSSYATSVTCRNQRISETLEEIFGTRDQDQNLDRKPRIVRRQRTRQDGCERTDKFVQSRKKMSRQTSIEPQGSAITIVPRRLVWGIERKLNEQKEINSSNHPGQNNRTDSKDTVGDELIAIWNFKINRLVKGKINLNKAVSYCYKIMILTNR